MWQRDGSTAWRMNWNNAKTYCSNLGLWWYTDWRLPDLTELISIMDYTRNSPSMDTRFTNIINTFYWSSTTFSNSINNARVLSLDYGTPYRYDKRRSNHYVICVR